MGEPSGKKNMNDKLNSLDAVYAEKKKEIQSLENELLTKMRETLKEERLILQGVKDKFWSYVEKEVYESIDDLWGLIKIYEEIKDLTLFSLMIFRKKITTADKKNGRLTFYKMIHISSGEKCMVCNEDICDLILSTSSMKEFKKIEYKHQSNNYSYLAHPECIVRDRYNLTLKYELQYATEKDRIEKLKSMPYSEYLQSDHWKGLRIKALKKSNFRCQLCNTKTKVLNVHHNTYERRGEEELSDLIVLCEDCHKRHHGINEQF